MRSEELANGPKAKEAERVIHDAETKIRSKDNEELGLFIEELQDSLAERGCHDEMDEYLLSIAEDEKARRS